MVRGAIERIVCGILTVIPATEDLIVMGIAKPERVHPFGIRDVGPAHRTHLRSRILIRQPYLRDLVTGVVDERTTPGTNEVHPAKRVFVVDVVVNFSNPGVDSIGAILSERKD